MKRAWDYTRRWNGGRTAWSLIGSRLHACAELKNLTFGIRVRRMAVKDGIEMHTVLWNLIIGLYVKCGSLDYARIF